jgi:hypothetical protein
MSSKPETPSTPPRDTPPGRLMLAPSFLQISPSKELAEVEAAIDEVMKGMRGGPALGRGPAGSTVGTEAPCLIPSRVGTHDQ